MQFERTIAIRGDRPRTLMIVGGRKEADGLSHATDSHIRPNLWIIRLCQCAHWSSDLTDANGKVTPYHGDAVQIFVKSVQGWKLKLASWNVLK